jgi:ribonucleotide reductase alpha subunit
MILTKNLNKVIDRTTYPVGSGKTSTLLHRPIGLGVQGLADVFFRMKIGFDSERAREINSKIFETIYYGALKESLSITKKREMMINELMSDSTRTDLKNNLKLIPEELAKIKEGKK